MSRSRRPTTRSPYRRSTGLTLLELLAVMVILSLVAGAALVRLGPVHEDAALRSFASALDDLDHRARLHAMRGERVKMEVDSEQNEVRLIGLRTREILSHELMPVGVSLRVLVAGDYTEVVFDRSGRSKDYTLELKRGDQRIIRRISGATGWLLRQEEGLP